MSPQSPVNHRTEPVLLWYVGGPGVPSPVDLGVFYTGTTPSAFTTVGGLHTVDVRATSERD